MWPVLWDLYCYVTCTVCDLYFYVTCTVVWPVWLCDMSHSVFYHHTFSLQSMHVLCMTVSRICTIISFMHSSIYLTLFNHCRFVQCFFFQEVKLWTAWAPGRIVRWDSVLDLVVVFILWGERMRHHWTINSSWKSTDSYNFFPFFFLFSVYLVFFCSFLSFG